jgi:hypothetical protein
MRLFVLRIKQPMPRSLVSLEVFFIVKNADGGSIGEILRILQIKQPDQDK